MASGCCCFSKQQAIIAALVKNQTPFTAITNRPQKHLAWNYVNFNRYEASYTIYTSVFYLNIRILISANKHHIYMTNKTLPRMWSSIYGGKTDPQRFSPALLILPANNPRLWNFFISVFNVHFQSYDSYLIFNFKAEIRQNTSFIRATES